LRKRNFIIITISSAFLLFSLMAGCSKKKKKKTTSKNNTNIAANKCDCPKIKVCTTKEALSLKKERCLKWQTAEIKKTNPSAKAPSLSKIEVYITKVNPIGVVKYYRSDNSLACREVDINGDGLMDLFYFYDGSGRIKKEIQQDSDRDGIIDHVRIFKNDIIFRELYNFDGDESTFEVEKTFNNGVITQIAFRIINPPGSQKRVCENFNYFENFDTKGQLISISWDTDCDGDMDRVRSKDGKFDSDAYKEITLDKNVEKSKLKDDDTSIAPK
jgi:hypothetical protein